MTDRLNEIYSALPECKVFADIGCDHGYVAKAMLDGKKCREVIISDVSAKCLEKAEKLLYAYIKAGKARSVVSDGFEKIDLCDLALIAGMGGEEIIKIISNAKSLPDNLVLQPMKNVDKVRKFVVEKGYKIEKDYVFKAEDKFYDLILIKKGRDVLTDEEIEFGRTNIILRQTAFIERILLEIKKCEKLLASGKITGEPLSAMKERLVRIKKYV